MLRAGAVVTLKDADGQNGTAEGQKAYADRQADDEPSHDVVLLSGASQPVLTVPTLACSFHVSFAE